jgi:hypothetical protein
MTIISTKPFQDIIGLKKIEISYSSESGAKESFTLSLVFSCPDAYIISRVEKTMVSTSDQNSPPLVSIA